MDITFQNINRIGEVVTENELFVHIHNRDMPLMYDANYLEFKRIPSVMEFKEADRYLRQFHIDNGQFHVKYLMPQNEQIPLELAEFLFDFGYIVGCMELYAIHPRQFPAVCVNPDIKVEPVKRSELESYLQFQYELDKQFGTDYAEDRQGQHRRDFYDERIMQLFAQYRGVLAGSVSVIISENTVEIDSLTVLEAYQKKGIGTSLQKYVMDHFENKQVILVANGQDTPRIMYQKQNYQYCGFKLEIMKLLK